MRNDVTPSAPADEASEAPRGAGAGGGLEGAGRDESIDGVWELAANGISLCARPALPPSAPGPSVVSVVAAGLGDAGRVNVRGSRGVRVTAGPPSLPPTDSTATNGVEVVVGPAGSLTLQRGLLPTDQKVELAPGGITIDAGAAAVTIRSLSSIELSVAGGLAKLRLGPEGVTIEAITIRLSATLQAQVQGVMNSISASGINRIGGPMTMIG